MGYSPPLSWVAVRSLNRLEAAMRDKNLSGRELSELVATSPQTISQLRHGTRRRVRTELAHRIEAVLDIEPGELFRADEVSAA